TPLEQNHALATPAPKLKKEDGLIDWLLPASEIHNRIRAFNPYPICHTSELESKRILRIHRAQLLSENDLSPGMLRIDANHRPVVGTGKGSLRLLEVQWEGKPR